jgi:hypothetical protein
MSRRAVLAAALSLTLVPVAAFATDEPAPAEGGPQDAVVVAVIDSGFSPYHQDYLASTMPQATDADPGNDLPLDQAPDEWLPGFPDPSAFADYAPLEIDTAGIADPTGNPATLAAADGEQWSTVTRSTSEAVQYRYLPGTKVIGALTFGTGRVLDGTGAHGMGTASSSVGNLYGTCPSCLLLFIQYGNQAGAEDAIGWAMDQPWIDVITNSYGFSMASRDRFYAGSDTEAQREAVERGQ